MPFDPNDPTTSLPDEILLRIFEEVLEENPQQPLDANKRWCQISQDNKLWEKLYSHFIGDPSRISEAYPEVNYRNQCLTILNQYQKLSENQKLGYSVYHGYDRLLSNFLEKNPNVDLHFKGEKKQNLMHAIHLAAKRGHSNLFNILLTRDPLVLDVQDIIGKILIFNEIKIMTITEGKQKLPLHIAAEKGYLEIVKVLLQYIVENKIKTEEILDKPDNYGWTALHYACANGHFEVVKALIAAEAKTDLVTIDGETILHLACAKNHENIAKYLPRDIPV